MTLSKQLKIERIVKNLRATVRFARSVILGLMVVSCIYVLIVGSCVLSDVCYLANV